MSDQLSLLNFFRCKDLRSLLDSVSSVFEQVGFPYVVLKWCPAPGSNAMMTANSSSVWSNFSARIGSDGAELLAALTNSIRVGLRKSHGDTLERQAWKSQQSQVFWVIDDAPKDYYLSAFQRTLICDFGQGEWTEFVALPLCRERDRVLVLEAKTHEPVSSEVRAFVEQACSVFLSVYRCLHGELSSQLNDTRLAATDRALSQKELDCLQWLAAGKTLTEAATILGITERTLRYHICNARERLGVATTMQAVVAAALIYGFDPHDARNSVYATCRIPTNALPAAVG